jgi:hypothetical protein
MGIRPHLPPKPFLSMRPLLCILLCWPSWLGSQAILMPDTIRTIRFDDADGTALPLVFTSNGAGVPTLFGGAYQPGITSLSTNANYVFSDPEDPDVRAFGFKRASNSNVAHLELNLVNQTGRDLRRLRVRLRLWQVSQQGRATAVSVRYVQYPVGAANSISQGPLFVATTAGANSNLSPVRKSWVDHTIVMPTPVAISDTFRVGIHFANGDGSGGNAHMAIEEIGLYPDFHPMTVSDVTGWRMLASPVSGATVEDWNSHFGVQGAAGLPHAWAAVNLYSGYDGSEWVPANQAADAIASGRGVLWYRFPGPEKEAGLFGHEPESDVDVPLHADGNRWNLMGNPFASAIEVSALRMDGDAPDAVAVWTAGDGTGPGSWLLSTDPGFDGILAAWQGFMVWNGGETPASIFRIPHAAKTSGGTLRKEHPSASVLPLALSRFEADRWVLHDRSAQLWFGRAPRIGIPRLVSLEPMAGGLSFGHQSVAAVEHTDAGAARIPLTAHLPESGLWRVQWEAGRMPADWHLRIVDKALGVETAFDEESAYGFQSDPGEIRGRFEILAIPMSTSIVSEPLADGIRLTEAWPNPFNPSTVVGWQLSVGGRTSVIVYDLLGREIAVLVDATLPAGEHNVRFDAGNLPSGLYLVRLESGGRSDTRRITLLK